MRITFESRSEMMTWLLTYGAVLFPWIVWEPITRAAKRRGDKRQYFLVAVAHAY